MRKDINIMFAVTAALVLIYLVTRSSPSSEDRYEKVLSKLLSDVSTEEIARIEIKAPKVLTPEEKALNEGRYEQLTFVKVGGDWILATFYNAVANKHMVERIITALKDASLRNVDVPDDKLKDLLLDEEHAARVVGKRDNGDLLFDFAVGKRLEGEQGCWMQVAGKKPVYKASKNIQEAIGLSENKTSELEPKRWLDKRFIRLKAEEFATVATVNLADEATYAWAAEEVRDDKDVKSAADDKNGKASANDGDDEGRKKQKYRWVLKHPDLKYPIDQKKVSDWIKSLPNMTADDIVPTDTLREKGYTKGDRVLQIEVRGKNVPDRFIFVVREDEIYVLSQNDPLSFKISRTTLNSIFRPLGTLADLTVLTLDKSKVTSYSAESPYKSLSLKKTGAEWRLESPELPYHFTGQEVVENVVKQLSSLKAMDVYKKDVDLKTFTHTLRVTEDKTEHVLKFDDKSVKDAVLLYYNEHTYKLEAFSINNLFPKLGALIEWKLIDQDTNFARRIEYRNNDETYELENIRKEWILTCNGYKFKAKPNVVEQLMWIVDAFIPADLISKNTSKLRPSIYIKYSFIDSDYSVAAGRFEDICFVIYKDRSYLIDESDYNNFLKTVDKLSEMLLFEQYTRECKKVTIERDGKTAEIDRAKLKSIKVKGFEDASASHGKVLTITVESPDGPVVFTVTSKEKSDSYFVTVEGSKYSAVVDKAEFDKALEN